MSLFAEPGSRKSVMWALLLGALASGAIHWLYWNTGAFGDEGSFCTLGQELLHGHLPYRDYFNEKMPLQYVWTAAVMRVSTIGIEGTRLAAGISLAAVFSMFAYQLRFRSLTESMPPLLLLGVVCAGMRGYNNSAEASLAVLYGLAAMLIARDDNSQGHARAVALGLGLIHGLAIGFRQTGVACAIVVLASPWVSGCRKAFVSGVVIALSGWIGLLAAIGLEPSQLWNALFFFAGASDTAQYFLAEATGRAFTLVWLALLIALVWTSAERRRALWTVAWLLAIAVPFFGRLDAFRLWPSTVAASLLLLPMVMQRKQLLQGLSMLIAAAALMSRLGRPETFEKDAEIASYLRRQTSTQDFIWVAPWRPNVYCLSSRESASRFYFVLPWTAQDRVRDEIMSDLERRKPKVIVDVSDYQYSLARIFPQLPQWLAASYHAPIRTQAAVYYHRRDEDRGR